MSETYRGGALPPDLAPKLRKLLEDHDRILTRGIPKSNIDIKIIGGRGGNAGPPSQIAYQVVNASGNVGTLTPQPRGSLVIFRFTGTPTITSGNGNLHLTGDFTPVSVDETLALISDGGQWYEVARGRDGGLGNVFIPVSLWGAKPNTGANMTTKIQKALDEMPSGSVLVFEPGTYICNGVTVTRNDTNIFLAQGTVLSATSATAYAVIDVTGTVNTGTSYTITTNPIAGERSITSAAAAAALTAGSWAMVEDAEIPQQGLPADPLMQFWYHCELAQVHSLASPLVNLRTPLINSYAAVGAGDPKVRSVTPVTGFRIWGSGTIKNAQAGTNAAHGIRLFYTVGAVVDGLTFENCWDSGIHATRSTEIVVNGVEVKNAVRFDSRGYGFDCHACTRVTVVGSVFKRLRHAIDFATFSRVCAAAGNVITSCTTGNINTHPNVEQVVFSGNVIDGAHGQNASAGASVDLGDSATQGSGINIDQANRNIVIANNTVRNCRKSGVFVDSGAAGFATEFISIIGNTIENTMLAAAYGTGTSLAAHGAISVMEQNAGGVSRRGIVVKGNTIRNPGQYGIHVGIDDTLVEGNWVYNARDWIGVPVVGIGIHVANSTNSFAPARVTVKGNIISECLQNGIRIGNNGAPVSTLDCVVEGNVVRSCTQSNILVEEVSDRTFVLHNVCESSGVDGIQVQAASCRIEGNKCRANTGRGIQIITGAANCFVVGNHCTGNTQDGIQTGANTGWLTDNYSYSNTTRGIDIAATGTDNVVKDNRLEGNGTNFRDLGTGTFVFWLDPTNDRYGIRTTAPARRLEILDNTDPQLRLTHTAGSRYADIQADSASLLLLPAVNAGGNYAVCLFGVNESSGLQIQDEPGSGQIWIRRDNSRDLRFNLDSGRQYEFNSAYATLFTLLGPPGTSGAANFKVPTAYSIDDSSTNTVLQALQIDRTTSAGASGVGIGARLGWNLDNNAGAKVLASEWDVVFDTVTAGAVDSSIRFKVQDASTNKEILRLEGQTPRVLIHNNSSGSPFALFDMSASVMGLAGDIHPTGDDTYELGDGATSHWKNVFTKLVTLQNAGGTAGAGYLRIDYNAGTPTGFWSFGAGDDAAIGYDGTDFILNPALVGSGVLRLNSSSSWSTSTAGAAFPAIPNMPSGAGTFKWLKLKDNSGNVVWVPAAI